MAGKWQLWYPHKIDAWQGSATVQTFSHAAYRGYHNLIMEQFQAPDGMLPDDDKQLARMSRLGAEWAMVADEVRAALTSNGAGRVYSTTQYELWTEAHKRHLEYVDRNAELRARKAAKHSQENSGENSQENSGANKNGLRERKTKKEKTTKTCAVDNRAADFRGAFQDAFQVANGVPAPWDGKEATNLARFLKANPTITVEQWKRILYNRHNSPINHKASLSQWISRALAWLDAPADEWGKPLKSDPRGAQVLPFQPVATVVDREEIARHRREDERSMYEYWLKQSEEFKRKNPWCGEVPA